MVVRGTVRAATVLPYRYRSEAERMEFFIFSSLNSIVYGMLLFMLSSGLTLIFSMMGVLNVAHSGFFMLGAYFAFQISTFVGFWPALILAPLMVGGLGMLVERYGLRTVHKHGHVAELLFTFGLVYIIEEAVHLVWGRMPVEYRVPPSLDFSLFTLFGTNFPAYRAFMLVIAVGMFVALFMVLTRTRVGLIIQAALTHPDMVSALGHNVPLIFMLVFGLGTAMAGLAGVIGGNYLVTEPSMAANLGPIVFVVVVVGGLGSLGGALIASLLIGAIQTFAVSFHYSFGDLMTWLGLAGNWGRSLGDLWKLKLSTSAPLLPYLFLVLMLIFRPKGLMGKRDK